MRKIQLRRLDRTLLRHLERDARRRNLSVNELILQILRRHFGVNAGPFHDLDPLLSHLAGQWTAAEAEDFDRVTAPFRTIDEQSWH